jgi:hypothetical protein
MLNLGSAAGSRGPYVIRQTGSAPGSMTMQQDPYLLRRDGVWVLNLAVFALGETEQQQFMYATSAEVMKALEGLPVDPVVEDRLPEGVSRAELVAGAENTASRLISGLRNARPVTLS